MVTYQQRLKEITGGLPPEEGDFNTALLTADDVSEHDRRVVLDDLRSVELVGDDEEWQELYGNPDDDADDQCDFVEPEVDYISAECECGWHSWDEYDKGSTIGLENSKKSLLASHASARPDCKLEPVTTE